MTRSVSKVTPPPEVAVAAGAAAELVARPGAAALAFAGATPESPPRVCVIAEIGVNHDGSVARALELTRAAGKAGADAIKLQLFDPRHLLSNQARLADYQRRQGEADPFEMLDRLKLTYAEVAQVREAAATLGLGFIVTPFSLPEVEALRDLDVDAVKIASPDAVNRPLLEAAAALGRPLLVSTGTCELEELTFAAQLIRDRLGGRGCLLQCVSAYPVQDESAALGAIRVLGQRFEVPVGYSDHTTELITGALAVSAGACVLEKHLTYDRGAQGPDHAASLDGESFARYTTLARHAATMLGPACKAVLPIEREVRGVSRQSVCVLRDLPAGHVLTRGDLTVKRPGTGIAASELEALVGRRLLRAVRGNDLLMSGDVQG